MLSTRYSTLAVLAGALLLMGCQKTMLADKSHPATLDSTEVKGIMRVTLVARAAERIGLKTEQVREETVTREGATKKRKIVPYGALMYDTKGDAWTFTNPKPLVFVRQQVVVETIEGDNAILAEGPDPGTAVVTVGAAELMGAEHKYGH